MFRRSSAHLAVLAVLLMAPRSTRAEPLPEAAPLDALGPLAARSRTGVIADRVLPLAGLERLDGSAAAPAIGAATWRQAWDELRRAALAPAPGLDPAALERGVREARRAGVIPLALLDRGYERVRPGALADGALRVADGRVTTADASALESERAFAAAALIPRTLRGAATVFTLDPERVFWDAPPRAIEIDFADGAGFRRVGLGERVTVRYASTGERELAARVTRVDGTTAVGRFAFDVAALAAPAPNDTLAITASVPWQGVAGSGSAYLYLAPGHAGLVNPVVAIEGFDLDNSMGWDELYELLNRENLIETLRAQGFDTVVLDFTDATEPVQRNGLVVAELIQQVQAQIAPQATLAVVGASMGALCSRYALAWLESQALPHRVRSWISFDGPHGGADVPLGLQYWIRFFSGQSADAAAFLAILNRPAARQMMIYHYTTPPGATGAPDPQRAAMLADFAAVGDYPALPRRVAIANGSGQGQNQGFAPGAQLIRWEYSSALVAITGNVWAVPDQVTGTIFRGSTRILFTTTNETDNVSGTLPWDGAPGGWRGSLADVDSVAAPYGDIVALHPAHCFVPTVSALALPTTDPFFDIAGVPDLAALTPFDAVYVPTANQEHVMVTPENAAVVIDEIERAPVAVPEPAAAARPRLAAGPNPSAGATRVTFTLPREALVDLRVFGVDGRAVTTLLRGPCAAGAHVLRWDGRDARGAVAPAGIYFLHLAADGGSATRRLVRIE